MHLNHLTYSNKRGASRKIMCISFIWYLLVPPVMTGLVIGRLGKVTRLMDNFFSSCETKKIFPCESSFPWKYLRFGLWQCCLIGSVGGQMRLTSSRPARFPVWTSVWGPRCHGWPRPRWGVGRVWSHPHLTRSWPTHASRAETLYKMMFCYWCNCRYSHW